MRGRASLRLARHKSAAHPLTQLRLRPREERDLSLRNPLPFRGEGQMGYPFVGRGTTAAVAARLGRDVRALDRAQAYVTLTQSWVSRVRAAARTGGGASSVGFRRVSGLRVARPA